MCSVKDKTVSDETVEFYSQQECAIKVKPSQLVI